MSVAFTAKEIAFKEEIKAWVRDTYPAEMKRRLERNPHERLPKEDHIWWHKQLAAKGWAAPDWPSQHGGADWPLRKTFLLRMALAEENTPDFAGAGVQLLGPVILHYGTPAQKEKLIPEILNGDTWWCQGFSETGAGSDLAALKTKAENKGDHYLINGAKLWTSSAQKADMMFALVRTGQFERRQQGITFLFIDMHAPGVTVRPIRTLDGPAPGYQEVNEVFFDNVEVPIEDRLGDENDGWSVAKFLLSVERANPSAPGLFGNLAHVKSIAAREIDGGRPLIEDPVFARRLAELEVEILSVEAIELRALAALERNEDPGAAPSIIKTKGTECDMQLDEMAVEAVGYYGLPFITPPPEKGLNVESIGPDYANPAAPRYFNSRKKSIYGGANEIQRSLIAKYALGL